MKQSRMSFALILAIFSISLLSGCRDNSAPQPKNLYAAGAYGDPLQTACYWVDGVRHDLGVAGNGNMANDITKSGDDLYIVGYQDNGGQPNPGYWKNGGTFIPLSSKNIQILDVITVGSDVYASGQEILGPSYIWKLNSSPHTEVVLSQADPSNSSLVGNLCEVGGSLCAVGAISNRGTYNACWWDGFTTTNQIHTLGTIGTHDSAVGIVQSNGTTRIYGNSDEKIWYWENDNFTTLATGPNTMILEIATEGNDVYVLAAINDVPYYWKNDIANKQEIKIDTDPTTTITPTGIWVEDGHVYVSGQSVQGQNARAVYIKDGVQTLLENANGSSAYDVRIL